MRNSQCPMRNRGEYGWMEINTTRTIYIHVGRAPVLSFVFYTKKKRWEKSHLRNSTFAYFEALSFVTRADFFLAALFL